MNKISLLFALLLFACFLKAQSNYEIVYDKAADNFSYFKTTYKNGIMKKEQFKGKSPKLKAGDVVNVKVKNYNPFLYYIDIQSIEKIEEVNDNSSLFKLVGMATSNLIPFSGILNTLTETRGVFQNITRSTNAANNIDEYSIYLDQSKSLLEELSTFNETHESYNIILNSVMSENFNNETVKNVTISKLKDLYKRYKDPNYLLHTLYPEIKTHYNKAGVMDNDIKKIAWDLEDKMESLMEFIENPSNKFSKKGIQSLIAEISNVKFESMKSFEMNTDISKKINIGEDAQGQLAGMIYTIKFYKINDLINVSNANNFEELKYVKYHYPNLYWNKEGKIVNTYCFECTPVLRAEGLIRISAGEEPERYFDNFINDEGQLPSNAVGNWLFYDQNGNVFTEDLAPTVITKTAKTNSQENLNFDNETLNRAIASNKSVEMPVSGKLSVRWTTGFYTINSFKSRMDYSMEYNDSQDSFTVVSSKLSNSRLSIGSQIAFDFKGSKVLTPSINFGAALDFWDDRDVHFLLGGGLKFKKFDYLGISAGISLTRNNQLDKEFQVGNSYYNDYNNPVYEIQSKRYFPGWYAGININF
jgi:hypothetical protein